jgi:hypothetical protein
MGLAGWRRIPQLGIQAQAGHQMSVRRLTHSVKQLKGRKTTVTHWEKHEGKT